MESSWRKDFELQGKTILNEGRAEGRAESIPQDVINMLKDHYPYEIISRPFGTSQAKILRIAENPGLAYD